MQQQCRQLDSSLPTSRQFRHRTVKSVAFEFKLTGNLTTFPDANIRSVVRSGNGLPGPKARAMFSARRSGESAGAGQ